MTGAMPAGSPDRSEQTLRASERFTVIFANRDATVFVLRNPVAGRGQPATGAPSAAPGTGARPTMAASMLRGMIASHSALEAHAMRGNWAGQQQIANIVRDAALPRLAPGSTRVAVAAGDDAHEGRHPTGRGRIDLTPLLGCPSDRRFPSWRPGDKRLASRVAGDGGLRLYRIRAGEGSLAALV